MFGQVFIVGVHLGDPQSAGNTNASHGRPWNLYAKLSCVAAVYPHIPTYSVIGKVNVPMIVSIAAPLDNVPISVSKDVPGPMGNLFALKVKGSPARDPLCGGGHHRTLAATLSMLVLHVVFANLSSSHPFKPGDKFDLSFPPCSW